MNENPTDGLNRAPDPQSPPAYQLEVSAKFNTAMRQAETRGQAVSVLLNHCRSAFSADAVGVYNLIGEDLLYASGLGLTVEPPSKIVNDGNAVLSQALTSEAPLRFETATSSEQDCDFCGFLSAEGLQSLWVTALRTSQKAVGVLFLAFRRQTIFSPQDEQLLDVFSEAAGNTLHRFLVMEQLEYSVASRETELQLLYDLIAIAGKTIEMDELLQVSLKRILDAVGGAMGVIHFVDAADQRIKIKTRENFPEEFLTYLEISGRTDRLWEQVYREGTIVQFRNLPDKSFPERPRPDRQFHHYLGLPIRIKGRVIGVLSLLGRTEIVLEPVTIQMAASAADELGLAIESAHFRKQAEDALILHERQRLAHDLHDSVSQSLYALVLSADVSEKLLRIKDFPNLRQELRDIGKLALQGLKEMRLMLFELRPAALESMGLAKALELRLNTVECRAGIEASLTAEGVNDLTPQAAQELYRIAIEALNNSLKHADASEIAVRLQRNGDRVRLEIQDDGCGFDLASDRASGGLGLESMRERAHLLAGEIKISSAIGTGTLIQLDVPIRRGELQ